MATTGKLITDDMWGKAASKKLDTKQGKGNTSTYKKCAFTHPVYTITDADGTYEIIGGSCTATYPDVDVFIALDWGGKRGKRSWPWNPGVDIYFEIQDMSVPKSLPEFKKLLKYTAEAMRDGKSVFVGCIGGHGRTGLFLAALTQFMTGETNVIKPLREAYCEKAVESSSQVEWLNKHFGIKKVQGAKEGNWGGTSKTKAGNTTWKTGTGSKDLLAKGKVTEQLAPQSYSCVENTASLICKK